MLSAEMTGQVEQEESEARRKRAVGNGITFNAIISLDVEIVLAAEYNDTIVEVVDEHTEDYLTVSETIACGAPHPPDRWS